MKTNRKTKSPKTARHTFGRLFEDEIHLRTMVRFDLQGQTAGAYLLKRGKEQSLVFGFNCEGIPPILDEAQIQTLWNNLETGLKDLPKGETLTIHWSKFPHDSKRQKQLAEVIQNTQSPAAQFLLTGERARVRELTRQGLHNRISTRIYVTYTLKQNRQTDLLGRALDFGENVAKRMNGTRAESNNQQLVRDLYRGFQEGFVPWTNLLSKRMKLSVRPMDEVDLWEASWSRFNRTPAPPPPQVLICQQVERNSRKAVRLTESIRSRIDARTHLTYDGVPEVETAWVKAKGNYIAPIVFEEKPGAINLFYIWERMSRDDVTNIECFCELILADAQREKISMEMRTKQANVAALDAATYHNVDSGAELNAEQSIEATRDMALGAVPIHTAVVFFLHRQNPQELTQASHRFASYFPRPALLLREDRVAWILWLQSLPIVWARLQVLGAGLFDRRMTYLSTEVPGLMPLTQPRKGDDRGFELIAVGGAPLYLDLTDKHRSILLLGTTRSGKSVLVAGILTYALANAIPVVAVDFPKPDGTSTFTDFTHVCGGAYFDIAKETNNILEIPDIRQLPPQAQAERLAEFKKFLVSALLVLVVGDRKSRDLPASVKAIESALTLILDEFLEDACICRRYDDAFDGGLGSPAWKMMPTLGDFVHYCRPENLDLDLVGETSQKALEFIELRLKSWIRSPGVGKAISQPSSFRSDTNLLVYSLTHLGSDDEAAVMALSAYSAALRRALASPASIFFLDEAPILFEFDQISALIGRLCANGAKAGIRVILSAQDVATIAKSPSSSKILQNLDTRLIGRIQPAAVTDFGQILRYPPELIEGNASESFFPQRENAYSQWLLDDNGKLSFCRYYPSWILLALTANNPDEQAARAQVMGCYPNDAFDGLAQFARLLKRSIESGTSVLVVVNEWCEVNGF